MNLSTFLCMQENLWWISLTWKTLVDVIINLSGYIMTFTILRSPLFPHQILWWHNSNSKSLKLLFRKKINVGFGDVFVKPLIICSWLKLLLDTEIVANKILCVWRRSFDFYKNALEHNTANVTSSIGQRAPPKPLNPKYFSFLFNRMLKLHILFINSHPCFYSNSTGICHSPSSPSFRYLN